uniref:Serine/threonine-protein phosphatase 1 regulatory subunit 10 n=2 Tax=Ixodes ricinus TaxID=34613 RepID=V5I3J7_IXORI
MAPIDPLQLLKALSPLLSAEGGIRSSDEVSRLSSLMKKFSRKLVSRCIYCNVLRATSSDILEVFLDLDGWSTIHMWLQEAKTADNRPFLLELLKLCQVLPMSLERLKENSSPKLIKGLTKCSSEEVRLMAEKVVTGWMKLIKGDSKEAVKPVKDTAEPGAKKKKTKSPVGAPAVSPKGALKRERSKGSQDESPQEQVAPKGNTTPVHPSTRTGPAGKDSPPTPKESPVAPKKPKAQDRPKTVKTFQTRFRSTGLEESPLPPPVKAGAKKVVRPAVDKNALLSARQRLAPTVHAERRVKPSSLVSMGGDGKEAAGPGIRLIAPKPVHVLQEDGGFMDALTAVPVVPAVPGKRKRKNSAAGGSPATPTNAKEKGATPPTSSSPTSPPPVAPKFQFYKDTLETGEGAEAAEEEEDIGKRVKRRKRGQAKEGKEEASEKEGAEESAASPEGDSPPTPTGEEEEGTAEKEEETVEKKEEEVEVGAGDASAGSDKLASDRPASILSMTRKKTKKTVRWVEESKLKQFHFFDLDETERVNVNNMQNFGDLKTLEMKRERQVVETARRMMGDRMEEALPYRMPRLLERPEPLAEPGSGSHEKEVQKLRQQKTLQEIYFSKDMIPDSPYEPDAEQVSGQEPKQIPLEDENSPSATLDYSNMEVPKASSLPSILSNLVLSIASKTQGGPQGPPQQGGQAPQGHMMPGGHVRMPGQQHHQGPMPGQMQGQMPPQSMMPDMQGPPIHMGGGGGNLLGGDPQCQNGPPNFMHPNNMQGQGMNMMGPPVSMAGGGGFPNMGMPMGHGGGNGGGGGDWGMMPPMGAEGDFFRGPPPGMGGGGPPMGMGGGAPPPPMGSAVQHMMDMARGNMPPHGGGRNSRMRTPRVPCKYYMTSTCRFGTSCSFLHPGVNGPPLQ